jgi:hypothetical protein
MPAHLLVANFHEQKFHDIHKAKSISGKLVLS